MIYSIPLQAVVLPTLIGLGLAQDDSSEVPNLAVDLQSCEDLSCDPSGRSICSLDDRSDQEIGVGLAAEAVEIGSNTFSFTLISGLEENGFTGSGSSKYEYWDQQLFVGVSPDLDDNDYPTGCALMMQYLGQTFPLEDLPDDEARSSSAEGTTSCDGVVNPICQSSISDIIRDFNVSDSDEEDRCEVLTQHVSTRLTQNPGTCGGEGSWIANFFNVTGGSFPGPDSSTPNSEQLNGDCRPVIPEDYELYHIVNMRQYVFEDPPSDASDFYGSIFGDRSGFTPIVTVAYRGDNDEDAQVQFTCMQTFQRDGEKHESVFGSAGTLGSLRSVALPIGVGLGVVLVVL